MKTITTLLLTIAMLLCTYSCAPVMGLEYNHTALSDEITYQSVDLQLSGLMRNTPLRWTASIGYGTMEQGGVYTGGNNLDYTNASEEGWSLGFTPSWYLSSKRLQPYISCRLNYLFLDSGEKDPYEHEESAYYMSATPTVGLQFYLSKHFALNASAGYQWGKHKNTSMFGGKTSGLSFAAGISYTFGR